MEIAAVSIIILVSFKAVVLHAIKHNTKRPKYKGTFCTDYIGNGDPMHETCILIHGIPSA